MAPILTITLNPTVDLFGEVGQVRPIRKVRVSNQRYAPGGGGINVARVIATIGADVEAVFLGGGPTGSWLDALLARDGIRRRMVPISGDTRVAFAVQESGSGFDYRFVPTGPAVTADEVEPCLDIIRNHPAEYVVASGSLPEEIRPDIYATMAKIVADKGGRFVLDSSGDGLHTTLEQSRVFLVKPSLGELEQLVGHELDEHSAREAATSLVKRGAAEMVAVTMGAHGALLVTADDVQRMPAPRVKVRSAIGAGDAFLGAMVYALASGWTVRGAFHLGIAAGAAAVLRPGTELCRREDIRSLYPMSPEADTELAAGLE